MNLLTCKSQGVFLYTQTRTSFFRTGLCLRLIHIYHAIPLPCRAAKGLDCVFPIWFTQCGCVWFKHATPCLCHAMSMPFWKWLLKATAQHGMACVNYYQLSRDNTRATCLCSASSGYHAEFHEGCCQKHTNSLNCRTSSSDNSSYHADFHEGHGTVGAWQGHGTKCVN
jgi:hypothetical protein